MQEANGEQAQMFLSKADVLIRSSARGTTPPDTLRTFIAEAEAAGFGRQEPVERTRAALAGLEAMAQAPKEKHIFKKGHHVVLQGLVARPELNGLHGVLLGFDVAAGSAGRWVVRLLGDSADGSASPRSKKDDGSACCHLRVPAESLLPESEALRRGLRVVLSGLESQPELNGKQGELVDFDAEVGRWLVALDGDEVGVQRRLLPEHLQAAPVGSRRASIGSPKPRRTSASPRPRSPRRTSVQSASPATPMLKKGQHVLLKGIESTPQLNGQSGVLMKYISDGGRWLVQLDSDAGRGRAILPTNLVADEAPSPAPSSASKRPAAASLASTRKSPPSSMRKRPAAALDEDSPASPTRKSPPSPAQKSPSSPTLKRPAAAIDADSPSSPTRKRPAAALVPDNLSTPLRRITSKTRDADATSSAEPLFKRPCAEVSSEDQPRASAVPDTPSRRQVGKAPGVSVKRPAAASEAHSSRPKQPIAERSAAMLKKPSSSVQKPPKARA